MNQKCLRLISQPEPTRVTLPYPRILGIAKKVVSVTFVCTASSVSFFFFFLGGGDFAVTIGRKHIYKKPQPTQTLRARERPAVGSSEQVDQPVRLDGTLCGLVEGWANGCDWSELVASTSLDQGDLCRILRRAMEMLRQIPVLVSPPPAPHITALLRARC